MGSHSCPRPPPPGVRVRVRSASYPGSYIRLYRRIRPAFSYRNALGIIPRSIVNSLCLLRQCRFFVDFESRRDAQQTSIQFQHFRSLHPVLQPGSLDLHDLCFGCPAERGGDEGPAAARNRLDNMSSGR